MAIEKTSPSQVDAMISDRLSAQKDVPGGLSSFDNRLPAFDLDNIRVMTSTAPDGKIVKSNVLDPNTGELVTFIETAGTPTVDGVIFLQNSGKYFKRVFEGPVNVKWWGAKGDGINDDTLAIQSAVNFATSIVPDNKVKGVFLPEGRYLISDTLKLGHGDSFTNIDFEGAGQKYRGEGGFGGTAIICNFNDRPAINIQGTRKSAIRNLTLVGLFYTFYRNINYDYTWFTESNWEDPSASANSYSVTAPYAGISIDGYSGSKPAISYPGVEYGKSASNDIEIDKVEITGFAVGVVTHTSGSDGNGDHVRIKGCVLSGMKWGYSVTHTQARSMSVSNSIISNAFVCITNRANGSKTGRFSATMINNQFNRCVNIIDIEYQTTGISFEGCYGEHVGRLGYYSYGQSSAIYPLKFSNCEIKFAEVESQESGIPDYHLYCNSFAQILFENTTLRMFKYLIVNALIVSADGLKIMSNPSSKDVHDRFALTSTSALILNPACDIGTHFNIQSIAFSLDTGASSGLRNISHMQLASNANRDSLFPIYSGGIRWNQNISRPSFFNVRYTTLSTSSFTFNVLTDRITVGLTRANWGIYRIGSIVQFTKGSDVVAFVITGISNADNDYIFEMFPLSGYRSNEGSFIFDFDVSFLMGSTSHWIPTRFYALPQRMRGTLTQSSNTVTEMQNGAGSSASISSIQTGDMVPQSESYDRVFQTAPTVVSVNSTTGEIVFDTTARRTEENYEFGLFLR